MSSPLAALMNQRVGRRFEFAGYHFSRAETEEERRAVFRLRHEVYSEEGFIHAEEFPSGEFRDAFDDVSIQVQVHDPAGTLVGTTRFVLPSELGFPTEHFFDFDPPDVPRERLGEYGRLAIRAGHRGGGRGPMLGMLKAVFEAMLEHQITHVFAFMPPKLAASYAALGCVSVPLRTHPPRPETVQRRHAMRDYFARQEIVPVLFDLAEMMAEVGVSTDREEVAFVRAGQAPRAPAPGAPAAGSWSRVAPQRSSGAR